MQEDIIIRTERKNESRWLTIRVPERLGAHGKALVTDDHGEILRRFSLEVGNNAFDITPFHPGRIQVKIDTVYVTLLRRLTIEP